METANSQQLPLLCSQSIFPELGQVTTHIANTVDHTKQNVCIIIYMQHKTEDSEILLRKRKHALRQ